MRPKRTRAQIAKGLDADYYGYRDDDDGVLVELEAQAEQRLRDEALERWRTEQQATGVDVDGAGAEVGDAVGAVFLAHVPLPSDAEIEKAVLQRRKQELMSRYLTDE